MYGGSPGNRSTTVAPPPLSSSSGVRVLACDGTEPTIAMAVTRHPEEVATTACLRDQVHRRRDRCIALWASVVITCGPLDGSAASRRELSPALGRVIRRAGFVRSSPRRSHYLPIRRVGSVTRLVSALWPAAPPRPVRRDRTTAATRRRRSLRAGPDERWRPATRGRAGRSGPT